MSSFWMYGIFLFGNFRCWKMPRILPNSIKQLDFENAHPLSGSHFSNSRKRIGFEKSQIWKQLSDFKSPLSAILMICWHQWEDESRKSNMSAANFSPTPWNFCLVMSQAVRKPCFSTSIPRGQNLRFLDFPIPRCPSGIPGGAGPGWRGNRPLGVP